MNRPRCNVADVYFQWLCDKINASYNKKSYTLLMCALHRKDFIWLVPNDDNRAYDGEKLREEFAEVFNYPNVGDLDRPCSMLEMLVALSDRCDDIMANPDLYGGSSKWFWVMMNNIGLDEFTDEFIDEAYGRANAEFRINEKLNKLLSRDYERNGFGGLFPLNSSKVDQRKTEIWYQMSEYLVENYYK